MLARPFLTLINKLLLGWTVGMNPIISSHLVAEDPARTQAEQAQMSITNTKIDMSKVEGIAKNLSAAGIPRKLGQDNSRL